MQNSHDAAVLDFWVRSKKSATLISSMYVATNEGHPAAYKLHTTNPNLRPRDVIQSTDAWSVCCVLPPYTAERVIDGGDINLLYEDPRGLETVDPDTGMQVSGYTCYGDGQLERDAVCVA